MSGWTPAAPGLFTKQWLAPFYAERLAQEIRAGVGGWVDYNDPRFEFRKSTCSRSEQMPPATRAEVAYLSSDGVRADAGATLGFTDLLPDPLNGGQAWGGGVHRTRRGGYLAMHRDFNVLPTTYRDREQLERVANLIVYLTEAEGGELYLGDAVIRPAPGLAVLFDPRGIPHGHPWPLRSPDRISLAAYFYRRRAVPQSEWRSTRYEALPFLDDTPEYAAARAARADPKTRYAALWPEDDR